LLYTLVELACDLCVPSYDEESLAILKLWRARVRTYHHWDGANRSDQPR
jgi:hypothetical protein